MIDLHRLNGHRLVLNADLIKYAEPSPDTTITLVTGEKLLVSETCNELVERVLHYRANLLRGAWPDAEAALSARRAHALLQLPTSND